MKQQIGCLLLIAIASSGTIANGSKEIQNRAMDGWFLLFTEGCLFLAVDSLQKDLQFITRTVRSSDYVRLLPLPITHVVSYYILDPWRTDMRTVFFTADSIESDACFILRK